MGDQTHSPTPFAWFEKNVVYSTYYTYLLRFLLAR